MPIEGMTDFEVELLTPAEREALEDTGDEQATPTAAQATDDDDDAGDTPTTPAAEEGAEGDPPSETPAVEAEPAAAAPEQQEEEEEPAVARHERAIPQMHEGDNRDYATELEALVKKFDDGEITTAEYTAQLVDLATAKATAESARNFNNAAWDASCAEFVADNEQYGKSPILRAAFDKALEEVQSDPKNARLSNRRVLDAAHAIVMREFGVVPPAASKTTTRPLPKPGEAERKAMQKAPLTLAEVPQAAEQSTANDKWTAIDKLDGMDYERAVAALSDADYEQYSRARA